MIQNLTSPSEYLEGIPGLTDLYRLYNWCKGCVAQAVSPVVVTLGSAMDGASILSVSACGTPPRAIAYAE